MGKYTRKCRGAGNVAVVEVSPVGVRTRSQTLAGKRKRSVPGEFRGGRIPTQQPEKPDDRRHSPDLASASRCASNKSSDLVLDQLGSNDSAGSENVEFECGERDSTLSSILRSEPHDLESTAGNSEGNSCPKSTAEMPSEEEIEKFFSATEEAERKRFEDKYNFDVEKEVPLEGRWEWVSLK